VTTNYTYDDEDILREVRGGVTFKYVHGARTDEPLAREDGSGALTYFHADALGSVVKHTNQAGAIVHQYRYDAWGSIELGATEPGHAFTGREWDAETGLYYYRARYYDPKIGRFLSEDPIGAEGEDTNLYAYVQNRPTVLTDPTGLAGSQPSPSPSPQICKGFKEGHICCEGGKLVPCVPPGKGPHHECVIAHEQCHIDDCNAQRAGQPGPECSGRRCQPVACGTDECSASRAQWECLRGKGVSAADAAYVKKYAKSKGCNTSGWPK
jgi:RHS repeat-associated protein